tara:strand:+ start:2580 stop:3116 length:537 start_codon:yes stop_codon:yes gene_type:complete
MNYYETLFIVHPALEAGRLKDIVNIVEESLTKLGGKTLVIELWGKRKLSYFIDKQKYGTYVLLQYNAIGKSINDFSRELELNPNVLAHLTTLINSEDVLSIEEDLDTQIAGKTRESEKSTVNSGDSSDAVGAAETDSGDSSDAVEAVEADSGDSSEVIKEEKNNQKNIDETSIDKKEE